MQKLRRDRILFTVVIQDPIKGSHKKNLLEVYSIFGNTWIRTKAVTHPSTNQAQFCLTSELIWILIMIHITQ